MRNKLFKVLIFAYIIVGIIACSIILVKNSSNVKVDNQSKVSVDSIAPSVKIDKKKY